MGECFQYVLSSLIEKRLSQMPIWIPIMERRNQFTWRLGSDGGWWELGVKESWAPWIRYSFSSWEGRWLNPPSQQLGLNVRFYLYSQLKIHILFIWAKTVDAQCCQTCKRFILFLNYQTIQMGWESVKWEVKRPSLTRELDWCPKNLLYNICKVLWQKH